MCQIPPVQTLTFPKFYFHPSEILVPMAEPEPAQPPPEQIGVVYTPSTDPQLKPSTTLGKKTVEEFMRRELYSVYPVPDFVRIQWVDLINNIRYRVVTRAYFEKLLYSSGRPGVSITKCALGLNF